MKKTGFTLSQHRTHGAALKAAYTAVQQLYIDISNCYGSKTPAARQADQAAKAIALLKSRLDDKACGENAGNPEALTLYYGQFFEEMARPETVNKIEKT